MINIFHNGLKKKIQGNSSAGYEYVICSEEETLKQALTRLAEKINPNKVTHGSMIRFVGNFNEFFPLADFSHDYFAFRRTVLIGVDGFVIRSYNISAVAHPHPSSRGSQANYSLVNLEDSSENEFEDLSNSTATDVALAILFLYDSTQPSGEIIADLMKILNVNNEEESDLPPLPEGGDNNGDIDPRT